MSGAHLTVQNLTTGYQGFQVLQDLALEAAPGITVIVGPNGAGKTTLMRCIADGAERSEGELELYGHRVLRDGPEQCVRYGLGRKFQNANVFDTMTVAESLRIATTLREQPSWWRRASTLDLPPYALEVLRVTGLDQCLLSLIHI